MTKSGQTAKIRALGAARGLGNLLRVTQSGQMEVTQSGSVQNARMDPSSALGFFLRIRVTRMQEWGA
jgi:hypothetical protein